MMKYILVLFFTLFLSINISKQFKKEKEAFSIQKHGGTKEIFSADELFDKKFMDMMRTNPPNSDHVARFEKRRYIVPNIVHYIIFKTNVISFSWYISLMSTIRNHIPDAIIIHCDCYHLSGEYWNRVKVLEIPILLKYMAMPKSVFGQKLQHVWHSSDVARFRILMLYGGIYLDNDVFVVNSLNKYRHYEYSLGLEANNAVGTQILIAERNATFLRLHYNLYHQYEGRQWYYNAGDLPANTYLRKNPYLVHIVPTRFGNNYTIGIMVMFNENRTVSEVKKDFDTIHMSFRNRRHFLNDGIKEINEENVKTYNKTFGALVRNLIF